MAVFQSPGVYVQERDISDIVPNLATATAALVGYSVKGNVDQTILVTSDQQFLQEYGEPNPASGKYFHYAALAYLAKGNQIYCLRVENGALYGGVDIMHSSSAEVNAAFSAGVSAATFNAPTGFETDIVFQIFGANPGVWDNKTGRD